MGAGVSGLIIGSVIAVIYLAITWYLTQDTGDWAYYIIMPIALTGLMFCIGGLAILMAWLF